MSGPLDDTFDDTRDDTSTDLRNRGPELAVAALLFAIAMAVITDSLRVGIGWADDGPRAGYFPFYVGLLLALSSGWVLVTQMRRWRGDSASFASRQQIGLVVQVLVPMLIYVALIFAIGIYVASALLIAYFMLRHGRYKARLALPVAVAVPLAFFAVFERWFLVPLPKGPIERLLGL
ncbi:MAG: tripartite tricarboxylate transporter TctB family protein [Burkholderiaceae bacterium]|nr:tripartite tricarboxylate transporter TctB family protein [Burkholderiaceae bacterium]